jgi:hypothetical protein
LSKGPGQIQRAIRELLDAHPNEAFTTDELCECCYPGVVIEKKHRVAVLRAAWNVLKDEPDWTAQRRWGDQGNRYEFTNQDSVASHLAPIRPHRRQPVGYTWEWVRVPRGFGRMRRKVPRSPEAPLRADQLRKAREDVELAVTWHRLVRDADPQRREELLAPPKPTSSPIGCAP